MPKCKNCGQNITRFDKEICPYCGEKHPFDENYAKTTDITTTIESLNQNDMVGETNYKPKSHLIMSLLCMFLGFLGIDQIYLGYKKGFIAHLGISALIYIALMITFLLALPQSAFYTFVLPLIIDFGLWFIAGFISLFIKNLKSADGEFLK